MEKPFRLTPEQRAAVTDTGGHCLVRAGAGCGKTTILVHKFRYLVERLHVSPSHILVLSFNRSTAEELRQRIVSSLKGTSADSREGCSEDSLMVYTFNSLALRILGYFNRCWPVLLEEVYENFDEGDSPLPGRRKDYHAGVEQLYSQMCSFVDSLSEDDYARLRRFDLDSLGVKDDEDSPAYLRLFATQKVDRNGFPGSCRSRQERLIFEALALSGIDFSYQAPLVVSDDGTSVRPDFLIYKDGKFFIYEHFAATEDLSSCAFSGKRGEKYLDDVLMKERQFMDYCAASGGGCSYFRTFGHMSTQGCVLDALEAELRSHGILSGEETLVRPPGVEKEESRQLDSSMVALIRFFLDIRSRLMETGVSVRTFRDRCRRFGGAGAEDVRTFLDLVFDPLERAYRRLLRHEYGFTSFTHSMAEASRLCLSADEESLAALRRRFRYRYVLVDEWQDTSRLRYRLLKAVQYVNPDVRVTAVGDDWQAIYGFSHCDLKYFREFPILWGDRYPCRIHDVTRTKRFGEYLCSTASNFVRRGKGLSHRNAVPSGEKSFISVDAFDKKNGILGSQISKFVEICKNEIDLLPDGGIPTALVLSRLSNDAGTFFDHLDDRFLPVTLIRIDGLSGYGNTIHRSKGLEADYVFLLNCGIGSVPYVRSVEKFTLGGRLGVLASAKGWNGLEEMIDDACQEERRLFYVALTRARRGVFLLCPADPGCVVSHDIKDLQTFRQVVGTKISPFVEEILDSLYEN